MIGWIEVLLNAAGPAALVTVATARGSVPREAGAKMVVTADGLHGTIGGGHLELQAIRLAHTALAEGRPILRDFALGPSLGQCCGGAATILVEPVSGRPDWLLALKLPAVLATVVSGPGFGVKRVLPAEFAQGRTAPWRDGIELFEPILAADFHVVLFGAGHVGRALVPVLAELDCRILWVDERPGQIPLPLPTNVKASAAPVEAVATAAAGGYFLVMTHSHQLDLALADLILARGDFRYFGLIGSATKRAKFEHRLRQLGHPPQAIARMRCPIGLPGIGAKHPAEIAIATAAELLAVRAGGAAELADSRELMLIS